MRHATVAGSPCFFEGSDRKRAAHEAQGHHGLVAPSSWVGPTVIRVLFALLTLLTMAGSQVWAHQLSGTIYGGGSPLQGATVNLTLIATGASAGSATTDAMGAYSFSVGDGAYNLQVLSNTPDIGDALVNAVTVNGEDVIFNVVLLAASVSLSGTVRNTQGDLLSGILVYARGSATIHTTTDANGAYSLIMPPGVIILGGQ